MNKTKLINPINTTTQSGRKRKKMARRKTKKPQVVKVYRRNPKVNYTSQVLYVFAGLVAAGLLNKIVKIPQKYLVGLGGSLLVLVLGKKVLGTKAVPIAVGMGAAGLFAYANQHPQLKGLLSDYGVCVNDKLDLSKIDPNTLDKLTSNINMSDYFINPHKAGMQPGQLDFSDMMS